MFYITTVYRPTVDTYLNHAVLELSQQKWGSGCMLFSRNLLAGVLESRGSDDGHI